MSSNLSHQAKATGIVTLVKTQQKVQMDSYVEWNIFILNAEEIAEEYMEQAEQKKQWVKRPKWAVNFKRL